MQKSHFQKYILKNDNEVLGLFEGSLHYLIYFPCKKIYNVILDKAQNTSYIKPTINYNIADTHYI